MSKDKSVLFDVSPTHLKESMEENPRDDRMFLVAPFSGMASVYGPSKRGKHKGYHRIKCEIWIPEDAIKGEDALGDFGAFAVISLPRSRVMPHVGGEGVDED